jgi:hypothetical protein
MRAGALVAGGDRTHAEFYCVIDARADLGGVGGNAVTA